MSDIVEQLRIAVAIPICKPAAEEIESLRQQLAEKDAEIDGIKGGMAYRNSLLCRIETERDELRQQLAEANAEIERLRGDFEIQQSQLGEMLEQLAASQAREQQLREALHYSLGAWHYDGVSDEHGSIFQEANNRCDQPSDTTALEAMIAKAGEVMRERCAKACTDRSAETDADDFDEWDQSNYSCADAIRALPVVTLDDLK